MNEREPVIGVTSAATLLGLLVSLSVAASICFDWGFLHALDLGFADVPSSIADHARSALLWLPVAALAVLWNFAYRLVASRVEDGLTEAEILASSSNPGLLS
ncbi:MAG: hypothetical protein HC869_25610 [Rhodospirillales bacterium]|nr:hypothetical protein [Rhodospirillales bacterium]